MRYPCDACKRCAASHGTLAPSEEVSAEMWRRLFDQVGLSSLHTTAVVSLPRRIVIKAAAAALTLALTAPTARRAPGRRRAVPQRPCVGLGLLDAVVVPAFDELLCRRGRSHPDRGQRTDATCRERFHLLDGQRGACAWPRTCSSSLPLGERTCTSCGCGSSRHVNGPASLARSTDQGPGTRDGQRTRDQEPGTSANYEGAVVGRAHEDVVDLKLHGHFGPDFHSFLGSAPKAAHAASLAAASL